MIIKLNDENYNEAISAAVSVLNNGGVIAYPTETFYALGARYDKKDGLKKLYKLKQRPQEKAMPLIIGSTEQLSLLTSQTGGPAAELIKMFWPGPLTLIFFALQGLDEYIVSENKVAVRVPGESFALRLARSAGFPITATSANISDKSPATNARMVRDYFGPDIALIIDGGDTKGGLPSTIVDTTSGKIEILRPGAVDIRVATGIVEQYPKGPVK